jgi:RimJ/RimL family protein N-acetyltransferase
VSERTERDNPPNIAIRPINLSDSLRLLSWRNHPDVRRWSRDIQEIESDTHQEWFNDWISGQRQKGFFFIIEHLDTPVGMIRFDLKTIKSFEISIFVDSSFQGKGIAKAAIISAINEIRVHFAEVTILASVHKGNLPSIELFKKLDFEHTGKSGDFLEFSRDFFSKDF